METLIELQTRKDKLVREIEPLLANFKAKYGNVDITTPIGFEEREMKNEINKRFSEINSLVSKINKLKRNLKCK